MLHWDSKPPIFPHQTYPRCNNWYTTHQPWKISNLLLFGVIWDEIGPPRGVWCHFGNFDLYAHNWLPNPFKKIWCIYKPINNNFRVRQSKIILFPTIIVCNLTVIWCFLLNHAPKFDLWTSITLLYSPIVWITHFMVQIYHNTST